MNSLYKLLESDYESDAEPYEDNDSGGDRGIVMVMIKEPVASVGDRAQDDMPPNLAAPQLARNTRAGAAVAVAAGDQEPRVPNPEAGTWPLNHNKRPPLRREVVDDLHKRGNRLNAQCRASIPGVRMAMIRLVVPSDPVGIHDSEEVAHEE